MLLGEEYLYLHLPKCAGTFVAKFLEKEKFGDRYDVTKLTQHTPIHKVPDKFLNKDQIMVGSIRNPWDYYVSLYTFKKNKKHGIGEGKWDDIWSLDQPFEDFLFSMYDNESNEKIKNQIVKFAYWDNPMIEWMLNLDIGLYTFHYIYIYFKEYEKIFNNEVDVFKDHKSLLSLDRVIKFESMISDMINIFELNKDQENRLRKTSPENPSNRKGYQECYSKELIDMVQFKERLIVDNYKYEWGQ